MSLSRLLVLPLATLLAAPASTQHVVMVRDLSLPVSQNGAATRDVLWGDFDADGQPDLFLANENEDNQLFHNVDGVLQEIVASPIVEDGGKSFAADWGDMDGDGDQDLAVANARGGDNFLYRSGSVTFPTTMTAQKITAGPVVTDGGDSYDVRFTDLDGDGDLDLMFVNRFEANFVYLNADGKGRYVKVTTGAIATDVKPSRALAVGDFDLDGDVDAYVANSNAESNQLYVNQGGAQAGVEGTFEPLLGDPATSDDGDSYGAASGDVDGDGDLDLFVANRYGGANVLYLNDGDGTFTDGSAPSLPANAGDSFAATFADVDGDDDLDLYIANVLETNDFWVNDGTGRFTALTYGAPVEDERNSRSAGFGDVDLDGRPDLVVADLDDDNFVFLNLGPQWTTAGAGLEADYAPWMASDSSLLAASMLELTVEDAPPGVTPTFFVGFTLISQPFKAGVLGPAPDVVIPGPITSAEGLSTLAGPVPDGVPAGLELLFQAWMPEPSGPAGVVATNTLRGITP